MSMQGFKFAAGITSGWPVLQFGADFVTNPHYGFKFGIERVGSELGGSHVCCLVMRFDYGLHKARRVAHFSRLG